MKKMLVVLAILTVTANLVAATLVLKGGKRVEVVSYTVQGNYVLVKVANGRFESYPLSVVDLVATKAASAVKPVAQPTPTATPSGPHSPFLAAKAVGGSSALIVTDADVAKVKAPDDEAGTEKTTGETSGAGQVIAGGYEKKQLESGDWEVVVTAKNPGTTAVQAVNVTVRALDAAGKQLAAASGTLPGVLEGGRQGLITVRLASPTEPAQLGFEFNWAAVPPTPAPTPSAKPAQANKPRGVAKPVAAPAEPAPNQALAIPRGASPNTVPSNPLGVVPPYQPPATPPAQQRPPA